MLRPGALAVSERQAERMQAEREQKMYKVQRTTGRSAWFSDHVLQLSDWLIFSDDRQRKRRARDDMSGGNG